MSVLHVAGRGRTTVLEPLWFEGLALVGLFVFASWLLGVQGVWMLLLRSDPTGITLLILVVFAVATLWTGARSRELTQQRLALEAASAQGFPAMASAAG